MRVYLIHHDHAIAVDLERSVTVLDDRTLEVDVPAALRDDSDRPERMPFEAWQVLDLWRPGDFAGLAELGIILVVPG